jgi:Leucine rich repeat
MALHHALLHDLLLLLQLADVPEVVFHCTALRTLGLGVNALTTVAHSPWTALNRLESLDLSNNQIKDIGDVCIMTWLRHLSLENNVVSVDTLSLYKTTYTSTIAHGHKTESSSQLPVILLEYAQQTLLAYRCDSMQLMCTQQQ